MKEVYLGLGSNLGVREDNLLNALRSLGAISGIKLEDCSSIYETEPLGYLEQPSFLNLVVKINAQLMPGELLNVCQEIEQRLGRKRTIHWGPRTIDVDLLLYGEDVYSDERLVIPHPRLKERAFVIVPLQELGLTILPVSGEKIDDLVKKLLQKQNICLQIAASDVKMSLSGSIQSELH